MTEGNPSRAENAGASSAVTTSKKLGLLSTLYFSQGLPFGFFVQALPVLLRRQGLSLPEIGLTSLLALPWALKFLWAPVVDASPRRKRWIVPLQMGAVAVMVGIALIEPSQTLWAILVGVFLVNLLAATQDVATDGLAVDELSYEERGLGNGLQVAGYRVGMIVGGGLMLVIFDALGWTLTFVSLAGMLAIATVPILLYDEPSRPRGREEPSDGSSRPRVDFGLVWAFLKRPAILPWIFVLVAYKSGEALAGGMLRPYLVDIGLGDAQIGWMLGAAGFTAGLLGAVAGGWGASRLGRWRALMIFGVLQVVGTSGYAIAAMGFDALPILYGWTILEHFTGGLATAALFTMMMDVCDATSGGTDYTIMASVVVLSTGVGQAVSGFVAAKIGYLGVFTTSAVAGAVGLVLIGWVLRPRVEQMWRRDEVTPVEPRSF